MALDFMRPDYGTLGRGQALIPKFSVIRSKDLMIRGSKFYAIWNEKTGLWTTDFYEAVKIIDDEVREFAEAHNAPAVGYMVDADNGLVDKFIKLCEKQMPDSYVPLDTKLIFASQETKKTDYATKRLPYDITDMPTPAFDELMSVLYSPSEAHKILWAIGVVLSGDIEKVHKFLVLYGKSGTGKSTVLEIIDGMFSGYSATFDAKAMGNANAQFALESFKTNPLVAIQQDGDLSKIDDNSRLNAVIAHEKVAINEKHKSIYEGKFKCFLFMGTNKPVLITDPKSGLTRRVIDVEPTGNLIPANRYFELIEQVKFEYGGIAKKALDTYNANKHFYDSYKPVKMIKKSNDLAVFIMVNKRLLTDPTGVTMEAAWEAYREWATEHETKKMSYRVFRDEIQNYFTELVPEEYNAAGIRRVDILRGFSFYDEDFPEPPVQVSPDSWLKFDCTQSFFDHFFEECPAQYATDAGRPRMSWDKVKTVLMDLDTSQEHYVIPPRAIVMVDFDKKKGDVKDFQTNQEAASKFPKTYAELSRSGAGIHLYYIYDGNVDELARYQDGDPDIEIKVFTEKSGIRRRLTRCNDIPIATINSGLSKKEEKEVTGMIQFDNVENEKTLRMTIRKILNGTIDMHHKQGVEFINSLLNKAYMAPNCSYDVRDLSNAIILYASHSTHHAKECLALCPEMKFCSKDHEMAPELITSKGDVTDKPDWEHDTRPITFYDCEVFPNLFLVKYKNAGEGQKIHTLINPGPADIEPLLHMKLVGFNNRRYDNHMIYACFLGYGPEQLYRLSTQLIKYKRGYFGQAYNLSHTDIYDFASAANKMSLKKWEIKLGIHHKELGLPWNKPVPKELWPKVADYCDNDVIATEAVFNALRADYTARIILAKMTGLTPNDTTNTLSGKLIFGDDKAPQKEFCWRDMGDVSQGAEPVVVTASGTMYTDVGDPTYTLFNEHNQPVFPGYTYSFGTSTYRGEVTGEGGYVYAEPGIYWAVALLDIASMHPSSAIAENLFGDKYTKRFAELKQLRIYVKHEDWENAKKMMDGVIAPFLDGNIASKDLANALKTVINSVYGLTSAKFDNLFRDKRNVDNIVAKRGALFMINLKHEVQNRGFTVVHIKTDSIKIANATPEIIQFCMDYADMYGYTFEHEATYEKMCIVNDAVYIAKYSQDDLNGDHKGQWTATGAQFAVPYVYKMLFSHEEIKFDDLCETKEVKDSAIYLDMNEGFSDVSSWETLRKLRTTPTDKLTKREAKILADNAEISDQTISSEIAKGHDYLYVGGVGRFCPIKPGLGGGLLIRDKKDENDEILGYSAVTGSSGYRWMESETLGEERIDDIDLRYYDTLVEKAAAVIGQYGDVNEFCR